MTYNYDEGDFSDTTLEQNISTVIRHDTTNYASNFITGRGNLTSTTRYDVTRQTSSITSSTKYNIAGAPVAQISPWTTSTTRTVKISYADNFNDTSTSRNTFAYPTKLTDPAGNYSEVKYRFDTGANVQAKSPAPANNTTGKETTRLYDNFGRLEKETVVNTGAYTRYEYPTNNIQAKVYATVIDTDNDGADTDDEVMSESWTDGAGRVRKSRTEHPGSTGGWTGSLVEYNILGQVTRSTVPTEINSSYEPAGDDATRGWLWSSQEYDWKGRIIRSIPTDSNGSDGKDQLINYEGCGCAGGQVTTIQSELVPKDTNPNETARRTQKVYEDILGRSFKTEVLNWDGSTVYTTALTAFNGRNQSVSIVQQDNTQSPVVEQTTTATFDGHGRLKTSHRPQQNANTNTTYNYNPDDSISSVTDARGATTSISYNNRGLTDQVSYSVPQNSNIPVASTVEFSYDAPGNRTQMTDGFGNVQYEYNSLSQIVAETRQFTDTLPNAPLANNKFKLEYSYNLSGRLASIKDPFGKQINYAHDKIGRLNTITGTTFADVTEYLSNIKYRAWGAPKEINYGNGIKMEATFNERLQANDFTLTKTSSSTTLMQKQYEYYVDGNLRYVEDSLNPKFDRLFKYDFGLRLKQTRTGAEARGETEPDETQIPYRQDYGFTPFGQLSTRSGDWKPGLSCEDPEFDFSYSYANNRNTGQGFDYDADGRQTIGKGIHNIYDSAGKTVKTYNGSSDYEIELYFDGNGQEVKRQRKIWDAENVEWGAPTIYYYIRSSVLGGEIISEAKDDGQKRQTFVYASGEKLATQKTAEDSQSDRVIWEMWDASRNSSINTDKTGAVNPAGIGGGNRLEIDPLGINANYTCFSSYPWTERGRTFNPYESPNGYQADGGTPGECYWDGIPTSCEEVRRAIGHSGEAVGDIQFFDDFLPVFSDLAGRLEIQNNELMFTPGETTTSVTHRDDHGNFVTETDVTAGPTNYRIVPAKENDWKPFEDLAAFLGANKNCAGLLTSLIGLSKISKNLGDLPIVDATSNNPSILNKTLDEIGLVPGSKVTLGEYRGPETSAETINNKIYIYDKYFNDSTRTTSEARGAVVFHEILHLLFGGGHRSLVRLFEVNHVEPPIPPVPDDFSPNALNTIRRSQWEKEYPIKNSSQLEGLASDSLQTWIDKDCKN